MLISAQICGESFLYRAGSILSSLTQWWSRQARPLFVIHIISLMLLLFLLWDIFVLIYSHLTLANVTLIICLLIYKTFQSFWRKDSFSFQFLWYVFISFSLHLEVLLSFFFLLNIYGIHGPGQRTLTPANDFLNKETVSFTHTCLPYFNSGAITTKSTVQEHMV